MHPHFSLSPARVLWTITFAAQLVLLVVLMGRDRIKRYPWFTAGIVLFAFRLLAEVLLSGRVAIPVLQITFITLADLSAVVGFFVLVELARQAFAGAGRRAWLSASLLLLAVAGLVIAFWGPWPARGQWLLNSPMAAFKLMQIGAQKGDMFVDVLTVELGIAIAFFGTRFHSGWSSRAQRVVIGLSTVALSWLAIEGIWQVIARTAHPQSRQEYERVLNLGNKLIDANKVIYIAALIWWIACFWREEPGVSVPSPALPVESSPMPLADPQTANALHHDEEQSPSGSLPE